MKKFLDVLRRFESQRLWTLDAAELLGMSERSFRRYRHHYEEEGIEELFDRRLSKVAWVLEVYRTRHVG